MAALDLGRQGQHRLLGAIHASGNVYRCPISATQMSLCKSPNVK